MRTCFTIFFLLVFAFAGNSQTYVELTNDMEIPSNSNIKIFAGEYTFSDYSWDGVIQIKNKENIILDGDSVTVHGGNFMGYMIDIENSSNVVIKNFEFVDNYKYAVRCLNSDNIMIENNNFSYNKKDTLGWIQIWTPYTAALGGGVLFYNTEYINVHNNLMTQQNDGVALYECAHAEIYNNVMNWNCGFGVRLNFTDSCWVHHNDLSHINRETDPSDCAAILLIVSNNNLVEYNDLSYSGDGIFLGQYEYSDIPNNNQFYYNDCSFSPHNAIEATFADGNIYKYNKCNYSHYGFWLGYSYNSVVDSNQIIGNQHSGIAIDRGYNNTFTRNLIKENPAGLEVWEGDGIPPYQNQFSYDYFIYNNLFEGNEKAIYASATEHLIAKENHFLNNRTDIYLEEESHNDTISNNVFEGTATFYIDNRSQDDIYAVDNDFIWDDTDLIACKMWDHEDYASYGTVNWQPFQQGTTPVWQTLPPEDMAEPDALWYAYPEACWGFGNWDSTYVNWDYNNKVEGDASIHLLTANGWDMGMMYRPGDGSIPYWSFTEQDSLVFWIKTINNTGYGFQFCHIKLGNNCGGYFKYTASAITILNPSMGEWVQYKVPLTGGSPWSRSTHGDVSMDEISYVEFHADTWEYGFELWLDGVSFTPYITDLEKKSNLQNFIRIVPNPSNGVSTIYLSINENMHASIDIINIDGSSNSYVFDGTLMFGNYALSIDTSDLRQGTYLVVVNSDQGRVVKKLVVM